MLVVIGWSVNCGQHQHDYQHQHDIQQRQLQTVVSAIWVYWGKADFSVQCWF